MKKDRRRAHWHIMAAGNADPIGHGRESHQKGSIVAPAEFFSLDNDVAMLVACDEKERKYS